MAKLALAVLAFAAIVAFVEVSAYKTTITTTTIEDNQYGPPVDFDSLDNKYGPPVDFDSLDNKYGPPVDFDSLDNKYGPPVDFDSLDNSRGGSSPARCRRQIQGQQLSHCQMHISQQGGRSLVEKLTQQPALQMCCNQLRQVDEQCQCQAIQQVVQQTLQQQQQQQGGRRGAQGIQQQQMQQILKKAQMIPNQCNLEIQEYCQIPIRIPN
uniref:PawS-like protein 1f n=1 Tax=Othonna arborescens TaxID=1954292 RepID=A0A1V0JB76_9ASTR|nr:PawS-like protein 1f [Othonna arborescens]